MGRTCPCWRRDHSGASWGSLSLLQAHTHLPACLGPLESRSCGFLLARLLHSTSPRPAHSRCSWERGWLRMGPGLQNPIVNWVERHAQWALGPPSLSPATDETQTGQDMEAEQPGCSRWYPRQVVQPVHMTKMRVTTRVTCTQRDLVMRMAGVRLREDPAGIRSELWRCSRPATPEDTSSSPTDTPSVSAEGQPCRCYCGL